MKEESPITVALRTYAESVGEPIVFTGVITEIPKHFGFNTRSSYMIEVFHDEQSVIKVPRMVDEESELIALVRDAMETLNAQLRFQKHILGYKPTTHSQHQVIVDLALTGDVIPP